MNLTRELILEKARETMKLLYPQQPSKYHLSQGWLVEFKKRHGIKSFCRSDESGLVDTQNMEKKLEPISEKKAQYPFKDVLIWPN